MHQNFEQGATGLIVLPTGYACAREMPPQGAVANALHALTLLISRQIRSELKNLDESIDFHVAPPLCPLLGSPYDFSQTAELIERAATRTDAWIAEGRLERREVPHEMNAHKHSCRDNRATRRTVDDSRFPARLRYDAARFQMRPCRGSARCRSRERGFGADRRQCRARRRGA